MRLILRGIAVTKLAGLGLMLLAGCTSEYYQKGQVDGHPLITMSYHARDVLRKECGNVDAVGCARVYEINGIPRCRIDVRMGLSEETERAVVAHEVCHCIARLTKVPDPCHDEDGGTIRP